MASGPSRVPSPTRTTQGWQSCCAPLPRCTYPYQVTAASGLAEHTGPGAGYPSAGTLPSGALGWVTCQRAGSAVGATNVWDKPHDGNWVSDSYLATPGQPGYTAAVPRC